MLNGIRMIEAEDLPIIQTWLHNEAEYVDPEIAPHNTMMWGNKGFYSFGMKKFVPYLKHLYIVKEERNFNNAIKLFKHYTNFVKMIGFTATVISVRQERLKRLIEKKFKVRPYDVVGDLSYYLVGV